MKRRNNAVVYLGMSLYGAVRDGAQFAVEMNQLTRTDELFDLYFASILHEHTSGAWSIVNSSFAKNRQICGDSLDEVISRLNGLFAEYENILFDFGGGFRQMWSILPYKRRYKDRLKLIVTTHSFANGTRLESLFSLMQGLLYLKYVDKVIFQCPFTARLFKLSALLFYRGKACIIPLPVVNEEQDGCFDDVRLVDNEFLKILHNNSMFKIIYLAEFRDIKKHLWLTKALMPIVKVNPRVHVFYCGSKDKTIFPKVKKTIDREGVNKQFHITGKIPKSMVPYVLERCSCAIVVSKSETFGFTYIEPMMAGIPVVGTRVGVGEYVIQDFGTGFGINANSPESLRRSIEFLMNNQKMCEEMGRTGQKIVQEMFSMKSIAQRRIGLYHEILH